MPSIFDIFTDQFKDSHVDEIAKRLGADKDKTKDAISMTLPALVEALGRQAERPGGLDQIQSQIKNAGNSGSLLDSLNEIIGAEGGGVPASQASTRSQTPAPASRSTPAQSSAQPSAQSSSNEILPPGYSPSSQNRTQPQQPNSQPTSSPSTSPSPSSGGGLEDIFGELMGTKKARVGDAVSKSTGIDKDQAGSLISMLGPLVIGMLGQQAKNGSLNPGDLSGMLKEDRNRIQKSPSGGMLTSLLDQDGDGDFDMSDMLKLATGFLRK